MTGPERDSMGLAMFAAWVNVSPDKVPPEARYHTCDATKAAWDRVADAAMRQARKDAQPAPALAEALDVVCAAMTEGEKWGAAVNAAMPILNADIHQSAWNTVDEVRDAINAALSALIDHEQR